jgi:hypothetical protein
VFVSVFDYVLATEENEDPEEVVCVSLSASLGGLSVVMYCSCD